MTGENRELLTPFLIVGDQHEFKGLVVGLKLLSSELNIRKSIVLYPGLILDVELRWLPTVLTISTPEER